MLTTNNYTYHCSCSTWLSCTRTCTCTCACLSYTCTCTCTCTCACLSYTCTCTRIQASRGVQGVHLGLHLGRWQRGRWQLRRPERPTDEPGSESAPAVRGDPAEIPRDHRSLCRRMQRGSSRVAAIHEAAGAPTPTPNRTPTSTDGTPTPTRTRCGPTRSQLELRTQPVLTRTTSLRRSNAHSLS